MKFSCEMVNVLDMNDARYRSARTMALLLSQGIPVFVALRGMLSFSAYTNSAVMSGGSGFRGLVAEVFEQRIVRIEIRNYGISYTSAPQLTSDRSECQCGTDFINGVSHVCLL